MGCYYTLCQNTYGYSLLFYKVYMKRENAGSCNSGREKEQILETYSAQLQKSWNSAKVIFGINKIYWAKKVPEGAHTLARRVGDALPPGRAPHPCGQGVGPLWLIISPVFFINSKNCLREVSGLLELCRIGLYYLLLFRPRTPAAGILPLRVNLVK